MQRMAYIGSLSEKSSPTNSSLVSFKVTIVLPRHLLSQVIYILFFNVPPNHILWNQSKYIRYNVQWPNLYVPFKLK